MGEWEIYDREKEVISVHVMIQRIGFATQWRKTFRAKFFKAVVVRRKWLGEVVGGIRRGRGGGSSRRLEITGGGATS